MIDLIVNLVTPMLVKMGASAADVSNYLHALSGYIYAGNRHVIRWSAVLAFLAALVIIVNMVCYGPMHSIVSGFLNASKAEISEEVASDSVSAIEKIGEGKREAQPSPYGDNGLGRALMCRVDADLTPSMAASGVYDTFNPDFTDLPAGTLDYVKAIKGNEIARRVKLADLKHNTDLRRRDGIKPPKYDLYLQAIALLEE